MPSYVLGAGDQLEIKLFYHPELNDTVVVLPDGKIVLQLIGEVDVKGATVQSLTEQLGVRYSKAGLRNPVVTVMPRKLAGQRVFVGGEVGLPKMVSYEGRLTLAQALFEAGGLKPTAEAKSIVVLRDTGKGSARALTVDFNKEVLQDGNDLPLQPYDVVIVPQSTIAKVNQFVEQYVSKMLPTWFSFGFSYLLGSSAIIF